MHAAHRPALVLLLSVGLALGTGIRGATAQIPGVSELCADRPVATGEPAIPLTRQAVESRRDVPGGADANGRTEDDTAGEGDTDDGAASASDLHCIDLLSTAAGGDARGVVELGRVVSPFTVAVTPEGRHVYDLTAWIEGLPDPDELGPYTTYVAWATPLELHPVVRLGEVRNGRNELGKVSFDKFMILVSAEASSEPEAREGPLVIRGRSPSSRMQAHDLLAQAPSATRRAGTSGGARAADAGKARAGGDGHGDEGRAGAAGDERGWAMPPAYPGIPMLPGMTALEPRVGSFLPDAALDALPEAAPREIVELPDGGTLDLEAGLVRRTVGDLSMVMMAFNGQHPGPLIRVREKSTIFVNFTNHTPLPSSIHWHGVRLDNRFDGVPGVTQEPVAPGETFRYRVFFRDAGLYWYHPHHREDIQQELGLYGNMWVESPREDYYGPADADEVLMLDDLLLDRDGPVPFGEASADFTLMGRFGNVFLVNGEPGYELEVERGDVVRFHLTNVSSTRTFNLSLVPADALASGGGEAGDGDGATEPAPAGPPDGLAAGAVAGRRAPRDEMPRLPIKLVASDVGRFEREEMVESVVLAPAERYVVEARFEEAGTWALVNQVRGIDHLRGVFRSELARLGRVGVSESSGAAEGSDASAGDDRIDRDEPGTAFETLRENEDVVEEIDVYRHRFDDPPDRELVLDLEVTDLPDPLESAMRYDRLYFHPVEWTGTMPMMNWATTGREVRWVLRDPDTGRENMAIDWSFRVGETVRLRLVNDRDAFHAMQHPIHIHGQRFLVLSVNGVPNDNLVWKDTVLLPTGSTTEILLELSNPGRWMIHCHIAEHLESGMKLVMDVES